jgi:hypothetical protein
MENSTNSYDPESDKFAEFPELYRLISSLPVLSKLFKKLLFPILSTIIEKHKLNLNHQFGFKHKYATTQLLHRIVKRINNVRKKLDIVLQCSSMIHIDKI